MPRCISTCGSPAVEASVSIPGSRDFVAGLGQLLVLFLTTRDGVDDRITTLTAGGDDYLTEPFSLAELVLRRMRDARARAAKSGCARCTPPHHRVTGTRS
jgi:two-component system OmpR family response regulator